MGWGLSWLPGLVFCVLLVAGCAPSDPKVRNLQHGVDVMASIASSDRLVMLTRDMDPDLRPSSAVAAMFSSRGVAGWPEPPDDVAFAPHRPTRSWVVVARPVDADGRILIEGYGDGMDSPLARRSVDFP